MAGDTILDVLSNPVRTPADVHNAISRAEESGKREICNAGQDKERLHSIRRATRILSAADALGPHPELDPLALAIVARRLPSDPHPAGRTAGHAH